MITLIALIPERSTVLVQPTQVGFVTLAKGFSPAAAGPQLKQMSALIALIPDRSTTLVQPTQVGFVTLAKGFSPAAAGPSQ